jgi:hypothetical protein
MKYIFALIWVVFLLLLIHNCHRIIRTVNENFDTNNNMVTVNELQEEEEYDFLTRFEIEYYKLNTNIDTLDYDTKLELIEVIKKVLKDHNMTDSVIENSDISFTDGSNPIIIVELIPEIEQWVIDSIIAKCSNLLSDYKCQNVTKCPLVSMLSSNPEIGDKWGDGVNECVRNSNYRDSPCVRCPPGTFVDYNNFDNICTRCPINQYSEKFNSLECKPCLGAPAGSGTCDTIQEPSSVCNSKSPNVLNLPEDIVGSVEALYDNNIHKLKQSHTMNYRIDSAKKKYDLYKEFNKDTMRDYIQKLNAQP